MHTTVVRSKKRSRTIAAHYNGTTLTIHAPTSLSKIQLNSHINTFKERIEIQEREKEENLPQRAQQLNNKYFGGSISVHSITFVRNQHQRYGSCTPSQGTIRLSHYLIHMPGWVLDYVIIHEMAHLLENNHSPHFWQLVQRYPLTERARGFLQAYALYGKDHDG